MPESLSSNARVRVASGRLAVAASCHTNVTSRGTSVPRTTVDHNMSMNPSSSARAIDEVPTQSKDRFPRPSTLPNAFAPLLTSSPSGTQSTTHGVGAKGGSPLIEEVDPTVKERLDLFDSEKRFDRLKQMLSIDEIPPHQLRQ